MRPTHMGGEWGDISMARLRIRDIAEQAGVSPATVSRYLNNQPGQMSDETRKRIAEVIERTGYRPRSAARNLRQDRSHLVGVMLADVSNPYSSAMLEALSACAEQRGLSLITSFSGGDSATEAAAIARLVDMGVDGLVVNTCGGNDEVLASAAARVPLVLLDREVEGAPADLVTSNNGELVQQLVDKLAAASCEQCFMLTERGDESSPRRIRARAFEQELERRSLPGRVVSLGDGVEASEQMDELLRAAAGRRLGVIAVNGAVFLRLVDAIAQIGPALPAGLRIATFDDYPWNHVLFGGVTTAAQDTRGIAAAVLDRLAERVDGAEMSPRALVEAACEHVEVPGTVVERSSTRP